MCTSEGKRPTPSGLLKTIVTDFLLPEINGKTRKTGYLDWDIEKIWDYGPIGYDGECIRHGIFEFYVVQLEGQKPKFFLVPDFGVDQVNRMVVASHKIEGFRYRGGGGRKLSGYAKAHFEFRANNKCFALTFEENHDRTGLIGRSLLFDIGSDDVCTWEMFAELYPER